MNTNKGTVPVTALALAALLAAPGFEAAARTISLGGALTEGEQGERKAYQAHQAYLASLPTPPQSELTLDADRLVQIFGFAAEGEVDVHSTEPVRDPLVREVEFDRRKFKSDPTYKSGYDAEAQIEIYGGKRPVDTVQPALSLGRDELYGAGEIGEGFVLFGEKNRFFPHLTVFGDWRTAIAYNDNGAGNPVGQIATRLNLFFDLKLTATERILMFYPPLQDGGQFTRFVFDDDNNDGADFEFEIDDEPVTLFLEGDLGQIISGFQDEYTEFDMPFAVGRVPLLFQNGVWMDDAFLGGAFTIPAQNSASLDITNYDLTFFFGFDEITSDAFLNGAGNRDDDEAAMVGIKGFFDLQEGYLELGAAYLHDKEKGDGDESYVNLTAAFSKRYGGRLSNATRVILNVGQESPAVGNKTANGVMLISENALITHLPLTLIPYANFWIGKDNVQPLAKADGVLKNVGLAFETDALTGFPKLDDAGRDTFGGAIGVQYLFSLEQQIVAEVAAVIPWDGENGNVQDEQFAASVRYQRPLTNQWIFRADAMYGLLVNQPDLFGARMEMRLKF